MSFCIYPIPLVCFSPTLLYISFQCGIGSEIAAIMMESDAFNYLDAPFERVTGADIPMPYNGALEEASLPQVADVVAAIERTTYRKIAA
jgi:pyruvate dehydrogenase E1 component beta subunit